MNYNLEFNDVETELPKPTIAVTSKLEKADKANISDTKSYEEKTKLLYKVEEDLLGKENLAKMLNASSVNEVDTNEVQLLFLTIIDTYDRPMNDYQEQKNTGTTEKLGEMRELFGEMNKVPDTMNGIEKKVR